MTVMENFSCPQQIEARLKRQSYSSPVFLKMIRDQNKSLIPHKVWAIIKAYLGSQGLPKEVAAACKFAMDWCLVAAQANGADKDSHVAFSLDAVTD